MVEAVDVLVESSDMREAMDDVKVRVAPARRQQHRKGVEEEEAPAAAAERKGAGGGGMAAPVVAEVA